MPGVVNLIRSRVAAGLLATAAVVAPLHPVAAQNVQVQDRAQLLRSQTPPSSDPYAEENGVVNGRAVESENDADIGEQEILKRVERYEPFSVSIATPFSY